MDGVAYDEIYFMIQNILDVVECITCNKIYCIQYATLNMIKDTQREFTFAWKWRVL